MLRRSYFSQVILYKTFSWVLIGAIYTIISSFMTVKETGLKTFRITGEAQGTTYHITYYATDSVIHQNAVDSILKNIDNSISNYNPESLVSRFNKTERSVKMDQHLSTLINLSFQISKETAGESDITVAPLVQAWGFGPLPETSVPDKKKIESILKCVGVEKLSISNQYLFKSVPCVQIDLNGIGQGYSVDVLAAYFNLRHIKNYMIEIGGELRVSGLKPDGKKFTIGIESPGVSEFADQPITKIIELSNGGVTTSGNYRKFFKSGNKILSHLIEPHTGRPIDNEMISVTIWAKNVTLADGYDNALMAMGLKRSFKFLAEHKGMEAYFIYKKADGSVADTATAVFAKMLNSKKY